MEYDGKTLRGSLNRSKSMKALHKVNAWPTGASISLGQVCVNQKSNEITAIPHLLEILNISKCLVSIDAIGCQRVAEKILSKGGDFLLALKKNQSNLLEAVKEIFRRSSTRANIAVEKNSYKEEDVSHGREIKRTCKVLTLNEGEKIGFFPHSDWPSIKSLVRVQSQQTNLASGQFSEETRFYISSACQTARSFNEQVPSFPI